MPLTLDLHGSSVLWLENRHLFGSPTDVEVGPVTIDGSRAAAVALNGTLNGTDGNSVPLGDRLVGPGKVGSLTSQGGLIRFDFLGRPLEVVGNMTLELSHGGRTRSGLWR